MPPHPAAASVPDLLRDPGHNTRLKKPRLHPPHTSGREPPVPVLPASCGWTGPGATFRTMETPEGFAAAERNSLYVRAAVAAVAIASAAFLPGARWGLAGGGAIAAAYLALWAAAWLTARPRPFPLQRQTALLAAEAALAATALYTLGTLGPAVALPVILTAHYAFLLGPRGGLAAGLAAAAAVAVVIPLGNAPLGQSLAVAIPLIAAAGAFAAYAARQRDETYDRLESSRAGALDEAHARRVLSALLPVARADGESHAARAIAVALPSVSGYPAAAVFLRAIGSEELILAAAAMGEREAILAGAPPEAIDADTPAALAVRQGVAIALGNRDGAAPLPAWARERGFASGIAAPILADMDALGAVYALRKDSHLPVLADLERTETFLALCARFLHASRRRSSGRPETDRLARVLEEAGRAEDVPSRQPIDIPGLRLDPFTERISVSDVVVSLSRTEFALLHSLAETPGSVVEPTALMNAAWDRAAQPGSNAVDVAMHRLRRKLAKTPGGRQLVKTVRGKGYMLVPPA